MLNEFGLHEGKHCDDASVQRRNERDQVEDIDVERSN